MHALGCVKKRERGRREEELESGGGVRLGELLEPVLGRVLKEGVEGLFKSADDVVGDAVDEDLETLPPLLDEGVLEAPGTEERAKVVTGKFGNGAALLLALGALLHLLLEVIPEPHEVAVPPSHLQVGVFVFWEGSLGRHTSSTPRTQGQRHTTRRQREHEEEEYVGGDEVAGVRLLSVHFMSDLCARLREVRQQPAGEGQHRSLRKRERTGSVMVMVMYSGSW